MSSEDLADLQPAAPPPRGVPREPAAVFRENLRRFAAGESLLNVVDKKAGY